MNNKGSNSWINNTCFYVSLPSDTCKPLREFSFSYKYLTTLYFILTFSTTTGYGDIHASIHSSSELIVAIV